MVHGSKVKCRNICCQTYRYKNFQNLLLNTIHFRTDKSRGISAYKTTYRQCLIHQQLCRIQFVVIFDGASDSINCYPVQETSDLSKLCKFETRVMKRVQYTGLFVWITFSFFFSSLFIFISIDLPLFLLLSVQDCSFLKDSDEASSDNI